jgi:hypothetical protein
MESGQITIAPIISDNSILIIYRENSQEVKVLINKTEKQCLQV